MSRMGMLEKKMARRRVAVISGGETWVRLEVECNKERGVSAGVLLYRGEEKKK